MIEEWVLLLTLLTGNGVEMVAIEGFPNKSTCMIAGTSWVAENSQKERNGYIWRLAPSYTCVQRK
jgi:hypothetical protein